MESARPDRSLEIPASVGGPERPRASELFWCHVDQSAGIGVFQHPQRTIGALCHIADAFADLPALSGLGSAFTVEDDASERRALHAADEAAPIPLREGLLATVEHQIARRDHRYPIEHRLRKLG